MALVPLSSIAMSSTLAPRVEIYTRLACQVHKPDVYKQAYAGLDLGYGHAALDTAVNFSAAFDAAWGQTDVNRKSGGVLLSAAMKPKDCASDPVVQAAVAKLTAGLSFRPRSTSTQ